MLVNAVKWHKQVLRPTFFIQEIGKGFVVHMEIGRIALQIQNLLHFHEGMKVRNQYFGGTVFQVKLAAKDDFILQYAKGGQPRRAIDKVNLEKEKKVPPGVGIDCLICILRGQQNVCVKLVQGFERTGCLFFVWCPGKDDLQSLRRRCSAL